MKEKYKAFISYRHIEPDATVAQKLQKLLEAYKAPYITSADGNILPRKIGKIFLDKTDTNAVYSLDKAIKEGLENSQYLIVVCSKETAKSPYCMEEIDYFKEINHGSTNNILVVLLEGEPSQVLPKSLLTNEAESKYDTVPLCANICPVPATDISARCYQKIFGKQFWLSAPQLIKREYLRIAAPLLGCGYDDLKRRSLQRKARRNKILMFISGVILFTAFAGVISYRNSHFSSEGVYAEMADRSLEEGDYQQALAYYSASLQQGLMVEPEDELEYDNMLVLLQQYDWPCLAEIEKINASDMLTFSDSSPEKGSEDNSVHIDSYIKLSLDPDTSTLTLSKNTKDDDVILDQIQLESYFAEAYTEEDEELFKEFGEYRFAVSPDRKYAVAGLTYDIISRKSYGNGIAADLFQKSGNLFLILGISDQITVRSSVIREDGYHWNDIAFHGNNNCYALVFGNDTHGEWPGGYVSVYDYLGKRIMRSELNKDIPLYGVTFQDNESTHLLTWSQDTVQFWDYSSGNIYAANCKLPFLAADIQTVEFPDDCYAAVITDGKVYKYNMVSVQGQKNVPTSLEAYGVQLMNDNCLIIEDKWVLQWVSAEDGQLTLTSEDIEGNIIDSELIRGDNSYYAKTSYRLYTPQCHTIYISVGEDVFVPVLLSMSDGTLTRQSQVDLQEAPIDQEVKIYFASEPRAYDDYCSMKEGLMAADGNNFDYFCGNSVITLSKRITFLPSGCFVNIFTDCDEQFAVLYCYEGDMILALWKLSGGRRIARLNLGSAELMKETQIEYLSNGCLQYKSGCINKCFQFNMEAPDRQVLKTLEMISGVTIRDGSFVTASEKCIDPNDLNLGNWDSLVLTWY